MGLIIVALIAFCALIVTASVGVYRMDTNKDPSTAHLPKGVKIAVTVDLVILLLGIIIFCIAGWTP